MGDSAILTQPCVLNVFVLLMSSRIILQLLACTINIVTIVKCVAGYVIYLDNVLECLGWVMSLGNVVSMTIKDGPRPGPSLT